MEFLYSHGREKSDPRFCQTHASVAKLFANAALTRESRLAWSYVAEAWRELAEMKQRAALDEKALLPPAGKFPRA